MAVKSDYQQRIRNDAEYYMLKLSRYIKGILKGDWKVTFPPIFLAVFNCSLSFTMISPFWIFNTFKLVRKYNRSASRNAIPPQLWGKDCKFCNLPIIYIQDLWLRKGEIFVLGESERLMRIKVRIVKRSNNIAVTY